MRSVDEVHNKDKTSEHNHAKNNHKDNRNCNYEYVNDYNSNYNGDYNGNHKNSYEHHKCLSKCKHQEMGVTITSLVVTIIVLLILAGITIKFALDDNGIIKQSRLASEKYQNKALQEQLALNQAEKEIDKASNSSSSGGTSGGSSGNQTSGGGSTSGGSENTDELKKQIEDLQNEVDSLTDQIQKEQQEKEQLQQQVNDLKKQQNEANTKISDLNNQIKDKDNKISDLTKEKENLESQINTLKAKQATGNAIASQVLAGATFSTSAGVGLTGTMVNHSAITTAVSVGSDGSKVYLRTTQGAYLTNANSNYPEICATISDINNATGYKYTKDQYDSNYNSGYNAGVSAADGRVNTSSASYTNGYNSGYNAGVASKSTHNRISAYVGNYTSTSVSVGDCYFFLYAMNGQSLCFLYEYTKINGSISLISKTVDNITSGNPYSISGDGSTINLYGRYVSLVGITM